MQAIGDEKGIRQAKEKIRQKQAKMRGFINDTGRKRRYDREQVTSLSKQDTLNHHQQMVKKAREKIRNKISKGKISTKINPENRLVIFLVIQLMKHIKRNYPRKVCMVPAI